MKAPFLVSSPSDEQGTGHGWTLSAAYMLRRFKGPEDKLLRLEITDDAA